MNASLVLVVRITGGERRTTADAEDELIVALCSRQGRKRKREEKCRSNW